MLQGPGEALFVPPSWHHQVQNATPALSINHNWLNAAGLHWCWAHLRADLAEAEAQIDDCRALCSPVEFEARGPRRRQRPGPIPALLPARGFSPARANAAG